MNLLSAPTKLENLYRTMHNASIPYRTVNQGIRRLRYWIGLLKDPPVSILDVGCGNGLLCELLVRMNYDVTGLDVVPGPYDRKGYRFVKHNMTTGFLPFSGKLTERFDYCLSFDVLEHLPIKWVSHNVYEMGRVADEIIGTAACFATGPLHLTVREPEWWMELISRSCPERNMKYVVFESEIGKTVLYYSQGKKE